jgi:5,10-methylenetetrahydromethanopterin reductase
MVEFGIEFVPRDLYWKTTYYAIQSEKTGFSYLWITDHFSNRNVYVSLSIISAYTDRIKIGPGVTNPYLIHPVVTAQAVCSLNEVAPGRVVCGLGVGDKTTLAMVDVEQTRPLSYIRESTKIIRGISSGEKVEVKGRIFNISGASLNFGIGNSIPILIGAQGPKMLALAAEVGDGVLINASHPKDVSRANNFIKEGIKKANKSIDDLEIGAYTSFSVARKKEDAMKAAIPVVAYIVAGCPDVVLERHNIKKEEAEEIRNSIVKGKWKNVFSKVTPDMIEEFSISGTPEICIEKISNLIDLGVDQIVVGSPVGPDMRKSINMISTEIFTHFQKNW